MTDNVKALNLYTADDANGWINDADELLPPALRTA